MRENPDIAAVDESVRAASSFRSEYYTDIEFAAAVGRTVPTVWRWWRLGLLPYALIGRKRVIPKASAIEWLRRNEVAPPRSFKLCSSARHRS